MNPAGMFVNTVTIRTATNTKQSDGSYTTGFTTSAAQCSIQPLSSSESIQYERKASGEFSRMYVGMGVTLGPSDEVEWGGVRYRVAGRARNTGGRSVFQTVDLERLK